jgi:hypothetical protein
MKTIASILGATALLCGCSVMHFKNGSVEPSGRTVEKWHHNVALSLYEVSPPLDMKALCAEKQWSMVTTKETVVTALAGTVLSGLWDPQLAVYKCGDK